MRVSLTGLLSVTDFKTPCRWSVYTLQKVDQFLDQKSKREFDFWSCFVNTSWVVFFFFFLRQSHVL